MMASPTALERLRRAALEIFSEALASVDAGEAVKRGVHLNGSLLKIFDASYDLESHGGRVYAVAIGKAATAMSAALDEILGERLSAAILATATTTTSHQSPTDSTQLSSRWRVFRGGHPLPNQESLEAARAAIDLVRRADEEHALILFLISGGGSAAIEWPSQSSITLEDLREANRALVSCGARISEINSVRRAFSAIKGGRLSALAPRAKQLSLIVSDTNTGEESEVASGPTFPSASDSTDPREVARRYRLEKSLPPSILRVIEGAAAERRITQSGSTHKHYLLLDNRSALEAAARAARLRGFAVEIAYDIIEQPVESGCAELLSRLEAGRAAAAAENFCLISGGEFACPVYGDGTGGRNSETVLRAALELDRHILQKGQSSRGSHCVILSAGTDGIDGNSPAAGAIADEITVGRAERHGLKAREYLERSDAYTFFNALGDAIVTEHTGTNARDVRIMLAG